MDRFHQSTSARCRALALALKRLFRTFKAQNPARTLDTEVNIIRKDHSCASYSHGILQATFPEFESDNIDFDGMSDHTFLSPMSYAVSIADQGSQKSLLPAKSLSHFNLHQVYAGRSESPIVRTRERGECQPIEVLKNTSTSRVQSHKPVLVHKRSTLQIRRYQSYHASMSNASLALHSDSPPSAVIRRTRRSSNLRSDISAGNSSHLVKHFASFCIIDLLAPGCPVNAVSQDLRYVYDIKDRFVLNAQEFSELSMDLSIGRDPDGNEVTYVMLFGPLVSPTSAESRFMLVSAIDVSGYIRYASTLDINAEQRGVEKSAKSSTERSRPKAKMPSTSRGDGRTARLADELVHGFSIREAPDEDATVERGSSQTAEVSCSDPELEDVWIEIAREEDLKSREVSAASRISQDSCGASDSQSLPKQKEVSGSGKPGPSLPNADDSLLEKFIEGLQVLYSQYFLLACSPLNGQFYEICYVSPAVYTSGEYVSGHLSHTSFDLIDDLAGRLAAGSRFRTSIRWGDQGVARQLYCVPLIGRHPAPWICMLVDNETLIDW